MAAADPLAQVKFGPDGLVPVVAQEALSGTVLMLAWADREALERTLATGEAHYHSRSRNALWKKGESSGHTQRVREVRLDCDGDAVLYRVDQAGPACHTGMATCFSTAVVPAAPGPVPDTGATTLARLAAVIARRAAERPGDSYTATLLARGVAKVAQKVGEEGVEAALAAVTEDEARLASESADLLYHLLVLLQSRSVPLTAVLEELERRTR
ncbi:MAG TPA: bifunctional phosphoribosyl-AMP cyclohydrolase/phosphoribosyl-ATP diphosphatase HisIE [Gemmatimonadales bacterium]|nr:bifunctional phosphoribosyl-AMP cyclohydrolase/phosphoribosyl-ATP diphosphatase HisIE [Gemmatimonadales bacterium]